MKKVLALTFLVFVALDITVCLQEHRLEKECCGMMASRTVTGSNICIPTDQINVPRDAPPFIEPYFVLKVNVGNIDEDVDVYLIHDTELHLTNSCVCREDGSILVKSESGFIELARRTLTIRIGDMRTIVRFYDEGFHLVNSTFTVSDIRRSPRPLLLISSLVIVGNTVPTPTAFKVCEVFQDEDGAATYSVSTRFQVSTLTGICKSFGPGWLHTVGLQLGRETLENEMYVVVVSSLPCKNITTGLEEFTTPNITIRNDVTTAETATPTPTSTPTSGTDGDDGGVSDGVIAGIVVAVVFVVVTIVIVVILAIVIYRRWIQIKLKRDKRSSTPASKTEEGSHEGQAELHEIQELGIEREDAVGLINNDNKSSVTDSRTIYVYDKAPDDSSKNAKLLAKEEEDANLKTVEEGELSIATVRRQNCVRVYIIFQESMEWLKAHHPQVWKFVRDFEVRPLPSILLSKLVLIRVYKTQNDVVEECIEGPVLVVNFHKDKWLNQPEECARLIGSKVHIHEKQICNDIDGTSSHSCSPPSDRVLTPTNPPPEYSHPPAQEPVPNGGSNDLMVKTLKEMMPELIAIRKATEKAAENTGRTADNTEGITETIEETRDLAAFIGNEMQDKTVDAQVPDMS